MEAIWGDEALQVVRFREVPLGSLHEVSAWLPRALADHVEAGHAVLSISANDPDLLKHEPAELVGTLQQTTARNVRAFREQISRNATNWTVVAAASAGWAARVFPHLPEPQRLSSLWKAIFRLCRLDQPDPFAAWEIHLKILAARRDYLNRKRYTALRYSGPGTDLTIGLAERHVWVSGRSTTGSGIAFAPNLPTEEVFTMPHKDRVDGTVRSSKPRIYGGTIIEGFSLRFSGGRIVDLVAESGEDVLRGLVSTDEGAARLGEVALVPHSSPISQSGLLLYSTLFDENAAAHIALGAAYRFTVSDGEAATDEAFGQAGGNRSAVHVDFMIGSDALDVDGVLPSGAAEPLMRAGEWVV